MGSNQGYNSAHRLDELRRQKSIEETLIYLFFFAIVAFICHLVSELVKGTWFAARQLTNYVQMTIWNGEAENRKNESQRGGGVWQGRGWRLPFFKKHLLRKPDGYLSLERLWQGNDGSTSSDVDHSTTSLGWISDSPTIALFGEEAYDDANSSTASPGATSTASLGATSTASPGATSTASPGATSTASLGATSTKSPEATSTASLGATSTASPGSTSADPSKENFQDENEETDMSTCSICSYCYNNRERRPMVLPCSHSFCQACLKQMEARGNKSCPNCRKKWKAKKVTDLLCCYQLIPGTSATKKVVPRCSLHKMALSCWCVSCAAALCVKCVQMNHMSCSWMAIEEKRNSLKSSGDRAFTKLKAAATGVQDLLMCLEDIRLREGKLLSWQHQAEMHLAAYRSLTDDVFETTDLYKLQELATVIKQIETLTEDDAVDPLLMRVASACKNK